MNRKYDVCVEEKFQIPKTNAHVAVAWKKKELELT